MLLHGQESSHGSYGNYHAVFFQEMQCHYIYKIMGNNAKALQQMKQ